ncbi:MAG: flagellin, partial [Oceanobacter sp.]
GVNIGSARSSADTASATSASDGSPIISSDKTRSAIAMADAINQQSSKTGVSAEVNPTLVVGGDGSSLDPESLNQFEAGDEAGIFINGISIGTVKLQQDSSGDLDTDRARADALTLINQASGKTGVTAVDNGVSLTLSAADGRNLSVAIDDRSGSSASIGALIGLDAAVDGIGESTFGAATAGSPVSSEGLTYETTYGTISLISASPFEIRAGNQGSENLANLGFSTGTFGGQGQGQFLQDLDISSFEGAQLAIVATDNAIEKIANQRAELGAVQNRLEASVSRLHIVSENLSSANSRILDADFAAETAEMSRTQVLQQAGMSVLAQANASSQQVLSLLG